MDRREDGPVPGPRGGRRGRPARSPDAESLGAVLEGLTADRPWVAGLALGVLAGRWSEVVGERLALECVPAALEGGALLVRASSAPWAAQVRFLAEAVRRRANEVLGSERVREVRVMLGER